MSKRTVYCTVCGLSIKSSVFASHLRSNKHKNNNSITLIDGIDKISSAFKNRIISYRVHNVGKNEGNESIPPNKFLMSLSHRVKQLLIALQTIHDSIKVNFEHFAEFSLPKNDTCEIKSFATKNIIFYKNNDFDKLFSYAVNSITTKIDEFEEKDSGWAFLQNLYLEVNINKYNPLRASRFIELPKWIKYKHACINIQNNDAFCFLWSIVAALFPANNNAHRTSSYPHFENILNTQDMSFPVGFSDIKIFEKNNKNISVNVYGLGNKSSIVGPLYKTDYRKKHHVNLLIIEKNNHKHYCLIKKMSRLLRSQLTKHHEKVYFCDECMLFFHNEVKLNGHICGGIRTVLPDPGAVIQFKHYERMQDMPFVIYADFESLLQPISNSEILNIQLYYKKTFTSRVWLLHCVLL